MSETNKQIKLAKRPEDMPSLEHFDFVEGTIPTPTNNEVLVRTLYLSVDPYMRGRMSSSKSYVQPFQLNETITGGVIAEVVESKSDHFQQGDVVVGMLGWQEYSLASEKEIRKIDAELAPMTAYLGILGMPGITAYFGLLDIGQPKEGETVVVSAAAGAVGSVVGQIAKIKGAHVVGIAGADEKINYIKNELGFDEGINYKKTDNLQEALKQACPNGIDVYYENVGGEISDAVFTQLNDFSRIPVCGAISAYNLPAGEDIGPRIQTTLIKTRALMKGFIVGDYMDRWPEATKDLAQWLQQGKLKYEETISEGFEKIPEAFLGLFKGENMGKQLVKVAEPRNQK
ncbi:NADP-dependent oxidoreductase [Bacillus tianshenii]|nr:NADP-dependent oxidoreductase [Bacillus tianshenii]